MGSTAASPPSPHRDYPAEILNGDAVISPPLSHAEEDVPPSLPSSIGAAVLSPSTSARASPTLLHSFLSFKNKGHASTEEFAAATTLCSLGPVTQDPHQGCGVSTEQERPPKPPPKKRLRSPLVPVVGLSHEEVATAATTSRRTQDPRLKKKLRSPLVPIVGSPGVNVILTQASPRSLGVKRSSPTSAQIPRQVFKQATTSKQEQWFRIASFSFTYISVAFCDVVEV